MVRISKVSRTFLSAFAIVALSVLGASVVFAQGQSPKLEIKVVDLTTGQIVLPQHTLKAGDQIQISIDGNGVDCAGQYVVSALGAPGAPPSVIVQAAPFIIGPAVGNNSVAVGTFSAGVLPSGTNTFKISTSCNGAGRNQFAFDHLEFFVSATGS